MPTAQPMYPYSKDQALEIVEDLSRELPETSREELHELIDALTTELERTKGWLRHLTS